MTIKYSSKNVYICSNCGKEFIWGEDSAWYGNHWDSEIKVIGCKKECIDALKTKQQKDKS